LTQIHPRTSLSAIETGVFDKAAQEVEDGRRGAEAIPLIAREVLPVMVAALK